MNHLSDIRCEVKGLEELERAFADQKARVDQVRPEALIAGGDFMKQKMADAAPKDSGFLAKHFSRFINKAGNLVVKPNGKALYPKGNKKHNRNAEQVAMYLEFGTHKMPMKPFVTRTYEQYKNEMLRIVFLKLKELMGWR